MQMASLGCIKRASTIKRYMENSILHASHLARRDEVVVSPHRQALACERSRPCLLLVVVSLQVQFLQRTQTVLNENQN
jgi:hypothetical protein